MPSCPAVASAGEKMIEEGSNNSTTQKRNYKRNIKSWFVWHISAFLLGVLGGFIGYSIITLHAARFDELLGRSRPDISDDSAPN
jgi:hypothetical protein